LKNIHGFLKKITKTELFIVFLYLVLILNAILN
jgi:hypothetical protein